MLHEKINKLKKNIISYEKHTENMINKSIEGLINKDENKLDVVIKKDEDYSNNMEILIDEMCFSIIAQFSPKAVDMRIVLMIMKMNNDLERIADHAVNIAYSAKFLIDKPNVKFYEDIPKMKEEVIKMLNDSISSFIKRDINLAINVCERDDIVDNLQNSIVDELIKLMRLDSSIIERAVKLINITHNLERIADLSTNIAEDVYYINEGKVIKHSKGEGF